MSKGARRRATPDSLHTGVIEIIVRKGARCRYTTIQNWSTNVYNLVTQRAMVLRRRDDGVGGRQPGIEGHDEVPLDLPAGRGRTARSCRWRSPVPASIRTQAAKLIHVAPKTTSQFISKSISMGGGRGCYRGLLKIAQGAHGSKSNVVCDALLLDPQSQPVGHLPVHRDRRAGRHRRPRGIGDQDR